MGLFDAPALIANAGFTAGRIAPVNYVPADGEFCFVVGSDTTGRFDYVESGDMAGLYQVVDFTDLTLLSFAVAMRQTEGLRAGYARGSGVTYPTGFAGGETLYVEIDNGAEQGFSFISADQELADVVARINATLTGAAATANNNQLRITSSVSGASSAVKVTGGTSLAKLGLSIGEHRGQRVSFRLRVYIHEDVVYEIQPGVGEAVNFDLRTVNVRELYGARALKFIVEAVP